MLSPTAGEDVLSQSVVANNGTLRVVAQQLLKHRILQERNRASNVRQTPVRRYKCNLVVAIQAKNPKTRMSTRYFR